MADVAGPYPADALIAVECEAVKAKVWTPKCVLEFLPQCFRLQFELTGALVETQPARAPRTGLSRRKCVSLPFNEGDGAYSEATIRVRDRIMRVLPSLISEP